MTSLAAVCAGLILAILVARAVWILRQEAAQDDGGRPRGIDPGTGYTEVTSDYSSGVGGGNQLTSRIPRDPQEYARSFVPRRDRN
ncbi:hypothetical protein JANAI62_29390 [Jannaschia pagri]|uniref:Secreted protein n=1 Tax=Jannaschia pagri TaxID=2829797 RepID=A0ABQ4NPP4_9RHOB|nr:MULTISPECIES: hypothetical protein [unclassified Jannaschia]GIT92481.1 hypothetical protein JANAI61_29390 [Jannaschia sp. AI_61]GIT96316.1 hypothetical protein JANAI62_29390 [Jannaschia sp. AI_62]